MPTQDDRGASSLLPTTHTPGLESPGSSVFDLPIQHPSAPHIADRTRSSSTDRPKCTSPDTVDNSQPRPSSSFLVISGGTGGNAICSAFGKNASYVLPVSDDGGSSSEIIRVLGGPSIGACNLVGVGHSPVRLIQHLGDIRSRLVRLIPPAPPSSPLDAIRTLLAYRLPTHCSEREARDEWRDIVEGRSPLWTGIPNDRKETIRGFLVYFESELLKRAHKNFSFLNGSIGNYFLAAAQGFFRSLPSAIFLFSSITSSQASILPVIVTNHTVTIAAELENGEKLVGQCEISHPLSPAFSINVEPTSPLDGMGEIIPQSQRINVMYGSESKEGGYEVLDSRISRLYYINGYGHEVHPSPNSDFISSLSSNDVLVYSCGSLWTSIIPCLALRGVASAIARSRSLRAKVLLLNSKNDRETDGYTAVDYINAIVRTLNAHYHVQPYGLGNVNTTFPISAFVTHLVYLQGTHVQVDVKAVTALGVRCFEVDNQAGAMESDSVPKFDASCVRSAMEEILVAQGDCQ